MSTPTLSAFLLLEGALLTGFLLARAVCVRALPLDAVPTLLRKRIERGNRLAPAGLVVAVIALVIGAALHLVA
jgi:hypothetical protein